MGIVRFCESSSIECCVGSVLENAVVGVFQGGYDLE